MTTHNRSIVFFQQQVVVGVTRASSAMEEERIPLNSSQGLLIGQLYRFHPSVDLPKLLLYRSALKDCRDAFVLRRSTIFVVLSRQEHLFKVICAGCEGWINQEMKMLMDRRKFEPIKEYRGYEDWQGNNYFLCYGRYMLGSHGSFFGFSLLYIALFSGLFFFFIVEELTHWQTLVGSTSLLLLYSVINLLLVAFTEPGIIPRNSPSVQPILPPGSASINPSNPLSYKYCKTCNVYRPPRSKHCKACDNCVRHFDHHCPFTSNCIGLRNRKYFYGFLTSFWAFTFVAFLSSMIIIIDSIHEGGLEKGAGGGVGVKETIHLLLGNLLGALVVLTSAAVLIMLTPFCWYHLSIISIGQTTNEHQNKVFDAHPNPHNQGCLHNYYEVCFEPVPPSLVPSLHVPLRAQEFLNKYTDGIQVEQLVRLKDFPSYHGREDMSYSGKENRWSGRNIADSSRLESHSLEGSHSNSHSNSKSASRDAEMGMSLHETWIPNPSSCGDLGQAVVVQEGDSTRSNVADNRRCV